MNSEQTVVFSDIDGTFLDHHTYEATHDSIEGLHILQQSEIPLIFCSSKTFAEQRHLQQKHQIVHPFILENGAAIAIPQGYFPSNFYQGDRCIDGYDLVPMVKTTSALIRSLLKEIGQLEYYGNATDLALQSATGLSVGALLRAKTRWYTETIITPLDQTMRETINVYLQPYQLCLSRGGRFDTVQSALTNKGVAVAWLMALFKRKYGAEPLFAGIGDSANDLAMLQLVHKAFLVRRPDGSWIKSAGTHPVHLNGIGPQGFLEMVKVLVL